MNLSKAITFVFGTAIGFGVAGIGIGAFLGHFTPSFYRNLLPLRDAKNVDTVEFGVGIGLVNGLIWGLVIGVLLVAIVAWRETRMARMEPAD